jgi:hypothetical protein
MKILKLQTNRTHSPPIVWLPLFTNKTTIMKIILTLISIISFSLTAKSQLDKGIWLAGGSGTLYSYNQTYSSPSNNTTSKYTNIELSASIGYFAIDKLVLGLRPSFSSFKGEVTSQGGLITNSKKYSIGPFARYYFLNTDKHYNILTDISYQFGVNKNALPPKEHGKLNSFSVMAGPEIFFNSSVGLEILLGYSIKEESINGQTGYQDNRKGFQVSVGLQIHLENL